MRSQTSLYPVVEFAPDSFEIDEFGCASIFVLIGSARALVIDAGMGVGDLHTAVRRLTDKPLDLVISHGHVDHIQNAWRFGACWLNQRDEHQFHDDLERRKLDTKMIASRYSWPTYFPYDIDRDVVAWGSRPELHSLEDGQEFDLGGRVVRAFATPGHTPGSMSFVDSSTGFVFVGDALNNNLGWKQPSAASDALLSWQEAVDGLRRIAERRPDGTGIFNGHHDYRALGVALDSDVLPNALDIGESILAGSYVTEQAPNRLFPERTDTLISRGSSWVSVDPDRLPPRAQDR